MTADLRVPHTRWCPARTWRAGRSNPLDKYCPRCVAERAHDYGNHKGREIDEWWRCQPCETQVCIAIDCLVAALTETPAEREAKARKAFAK